MAELEDKTLVPRRPIFFKAVPPAIEGITGELLYAGTFGYIFKSLVHENQIVKVSTFADICEKNKRELFIARYAKHVLIFINNELRKLNKHVTFSSTIVDETDTADLTAVSAFHPNHDTNKCYYNQLQILPVELEIEHAGEKIVLENLIQLLPGTYRTGLQLKRTGKSAAINRWSEIYDADIVKSVVNACGMDAEDYGFATSLLHGCFVYLGLEMHDVEFVVGSLDGESPHIFLIDFDKVEVLSEADRQSRLTEMEERGYSCPTILPNAETVEAVEHGVRLGKEIASVPTMADISFLPPCDDD